MYLIQLLLPLHDNEKQPFPAEQYNAVRAELAHKFGGVTAYLRAPAKGLWEAHEGINSDEVVLFEIVLSVLIKNGGTSIESTCNGSSSRKRFSSGPQLWRSYNKRYRRVSPSLKTDIA